jgi:hypothetical protein
MWRCATIKLVRVAVNAGKAAMKPQKGQWYRHRDAGREFMIVGIDEGEGIVEMQYADGNEGEMDLTEFLEHEFERLTERESTLDSSKGR